MKAKNIFIFFGLLLVASLILFGYANYKSRSIKLADESKIEYITKPINQAMIGQTLYLGRYEMKLENINADDSIDLRYSEIYLGESCSELKNTTAVIRVLLNNESCLSSTSCDAGDKICFKITKKDKNIFLEYAIKNWSNWPQ
ncbi:MAG: hypothetical protein WA055_01025 [Candidatus Moraniibacteriota bacterium]